MARRPKNLSQRPRLEEAGLALQDPRADVLTDVLGVSLMRNAFYKPIEAQAPWGIEVEQKHRAMFYLVARGSALLEVQGEAPVTLEVSDVAFIPHGMPHVLRDSKDTRPKMMVCTGNPRIEASGRRIGGDGAPSTIIAGFFELGTGRPPVLLERMPNLLLLSPAGTGFHPWIAATVQLVLAESTMPGPASSIILQRLADVLFVQALRSLAGHGECTKHTGLGALADPAIHRALGLVHASVQHPWTVAELAARVGLSRSSFAARFTELVGEPPLQYVARWRIARAAELLRETGEDVAEIAERVGYQSIPSFNKAFKRWHGTSPGAFRKGAVLASTM